MSGSKVLQRVELALALAAAAAVAGAAWAATAVVDQKNLHFSVKTLTVSHGDSVEFTNSDDTKHNITVEGPGFKANSGLQAPGEPFTVPLVKPGVYRVSCGIHPNMRMTIVVK